MARAKLQAFRDRECITSIYCKALSHPARVKIFQMLRECEVVTYNQLLDSLPLDKKTISQHLEIMNRASLIIHATHIRSGKTGYGLRKEALEELKSYLVAVVGIAA